MSWSAAAGPCATASTSRSTCPRSSGRRSTGSRHDGPGRTMTALVVDGIGLLVTNDPALGEGPLGVVRDAALVLDDGVVTAIEAVGAAGGEGLDGPGPRVIPGVVDSHTPPRFAGDRGGGVSAP